jgi:DNA modification methylase
VIDATCDDCGQHYTAPIAGEHRLLCGDATDPQVVDLLMAGALAELLFTDPPYNVDIAGGTHDPRDERNYGRGPRMRNDAMSDQEFDRLLLNALTNAQRVMMPGASYYLCSPAGCTETQFRKALDATLGLRQCIVWVKQQFVFGRQDYQWRHESILYGWKDGAAHYFTDDKTQDTVWEIDRPMRSEKEHPTQKPPALAERALTNSTRTGASVLDLFAGAGSTVIAAEQLGRRCYAMEIEPAYCDVIVRRWERVSGRTAQQTHP